MAGLHGRIQAAMGMVQQQLIDAASRDNLSEVRRLVGLGVDVNGRDEHGWTPLMRACYHGHKAVAVFLADHHRTDLNVRNERNSGDTALIWSVYKNHVEIVQHLLSKPHVDVNRPQMSGNTPLHFACSKGHVEVATLLLQHPKIDVTLASADGHTPFDLAVQKKHIALQTLIQKHVQELSVAHLTTEERQWLEAARLGKLSEMQRLVQTNPPPRHWWQRTAAAVSSPSAASAAPRSSPSSSWRVAAQYLSGRNALHIAAQCGHREMVEFLLEDGRIGLNTQDDEQGWTALHYATAHDRCEVLKVLLDHRDTDFYAQDKDGRTALDLASSKSSSSSSSPTQNQTETETATPAGSSPAEEESPQSPSASISSLSTRQCLLDYGGSLMTVGGSTGSTTGATTKDSKPKVVQFLSAARAGRLPEIQHLVENNLVTDFAVPTKTTGLTALHWATRYGHLDIVEYLVQHVTSSNNPCNLPAALGHRDWRGRTVLQEACRWPGPETPRLIHVLLTYMPLESVNNRRVGGWTALEDCVFCHHKAAALAILQHPRVDPATALRWAFQSWDMKFVTEFRLVSIAEILHWQQQQLQLQLQQQEQAVQGIQSAENAFFHPTTPNSTSSVAETVATLPPLTDNFIPQALEMAEDPTFMRMCLGRTLEWMNFFPVEEGDSKHHESKLAYNIPRLEEPLTIDVQSAALLAPSATLTTPLTTPTAVAPSTSFPLASPLPLELNMATVAGISGTSASSVDLGAYVPRRDFESLQADFETLQLEMTAVRSRNDAQDARLELLERKLAQLGSKVASALAN